MQPTAWPARDAQIVERQHALLQRVAADRARAYARAVAAEASTGAHDEPPHQGSVPTGPVQPRMRQIDLLTGDQWPAPLRDVLHRPAPVVSQGVTPPTCQKPPLPPVRTRPVASIELPSSVRGASANQVDGFGGTSAGAAAPSWHPRPMAAAAASGSPRGGSPETPLDSAPADFLCPIRCAGHRATSELCTLDCKCSGLLAPLRRHVIGTGQTPQSSAVL